MAVAISFISLAYQSNLLSICLIRSIPSGGQARGGGGRGRSSRGGRALSTHGKKTGETGFGEGVEGGKRGQHG